MALVNFKEKIPFPSIFARKSMFQHFYSDRAYAEPNFFGELLKNYFFQNVHFGPIRWVLRRFFTILINYTQNLNLNLVFLSNLQKL